MDSSESPVPPISPRARGRFVMGLLAGIILGLLAGVFLLGPGLARHREDPVAARELKLTVANLRDMGPNDSPQLREYLKGRIYSLLVEGVRADWVSGDLDFGPIDRSALGSLGVVKGPDSDEDLYRIAMESARR